MLLTRVIGAEYLIQSLEFRRVTSHRAGAMRLDQPNASWLKAGFFIRAQHGFGLARRAGCIDTLEPPVAGGANRADHGIYPVAITLGIFQPLQDHHSQTFSYHHAV